MTALPAASTKKLGLVIDLDTCVGCQACATSCKEWNAGSATSGPLSDHDAYGADPHGAEEHSYTQIVDAIRVHGAEARRDIEELWRRIAFSILITNVDDHLRNHGFLHLQHGHWRLAPAFDLNPFPDRVRELKTWISEETGPEASIAGLLSITAYCRLPLPRAKSILREVERAVSQWRDTGRALGMTARELKAFEDAFEHPERAAARRAMK